MDNKLHSHSELLLSNKEEKQLINIITWMDFKDIMASEKSQFQNFTYYRISFI